MNGFDAPGIDEFTAPHGRKRSYQDMVQMGAPVVEDGCPVSGKRLRSKRHVSWSPSEPSISVQPDFQALFPDYVAEDIWYTVGPGFGDLAVYDPVCP